MTKLMIIILLCALLCGCAAAGPAPQATVPSGVNSNPTQGTTNVPDVTSPSGSVGSNPGLPVDPDYSENKVPDMTVNQIRQDYCEYAGNLAIDQVRLRFMGVFHDVYVMFVDVKDMMYADVITTENVGGFQFVYSSSQHMLVWHEGEFYSLRLAFDAGLLTKENLRTLVKDYYAANPHLWQFVAVDE